jgi:hypothetical protein
MAGITRVHGGLISPKNFAGVGLQDFTLTFWVGDALALSVDNNSTANNSVAAGALDQIFRTAVGSIASVSRVGTLNTATQSVRFAIESLGFEGDNSGNGFLGTGPDNETDGVTTTAAALQAAVQALGTVTDSSGAVVHLSSATVAKFVY